MRARGIKGPTDHLGSFIRSSFTPQAQFVLFRTHVDNDSADFISFGELLADAGQQLFNKNIDVNPRCFEAIGTAFNTAAKCAI